MKKEATYKDKMVFLNDWLESIIETVKKDLKNDHLKQDYKFSKQYLSGKNVNKIDSAELAGAYREAIQSHDKGEEIAEFIANRWILKKSELYYFFETELSKVNPNFTEIQELDDAKGKALLDHAVDQFGALDVYIFSYLNSVAFSPSLFQTLKKRAETDEKRNQEESRVRAEQEGIDALKRNHELEISRLTDKFEKKLLGLQRKYNQDVEALKRQLANLQKKLQSNA